MGNIGIINCGISNLTSIYNAYKFSGIDVSIVSESNQLNKFSHVILPGVGAFSQGIKNLKEHEFFERILEQAEQGKPIMGICLGMQLLSTTGDEFGPTDGLNLIPGTVKRIPIQSPEFKLPHVGWNDLHINKSSKLFNKIDEGASFYFVHSFAYSDIDPTHVTGTTDYENPVIAMVEIDNVFGVQFHPEKSQKSGLQLLKNFAELC